MLLNSAKDVSMSLHGLITQAKSANGHDVDHPAYQQVSDYSKGVIMNITNFLKSVKMFEDESSRGTRAVESSIEAIAQEIHEFLTDLGGASGVEEASPEDVIRANRAITQATHKIVAASASGKQEDLLAAANMGRRAITELLTACKVECDFNILLTILKYVVFRGQRLRVRTRSYVRRLWVSVARWRCSTGIFSG